MPYTLHNYHAAYKYTIQLAHTRCPTMDNVNIFSTQLCLLPPPLIYFYSQEYTYVYVYTHPLCQWIICSINTSQTCQLTHTNMRDQ